MDSTDKTPPYFTYLPCGAKINFGTQSLFCFSMTSVFPKIDTNLTTIVLFGLGFFCLKNQVQVDSTQPDTHFPSLVSILGTL